MKYTILLVNGWLSHRMKAVFGLGVLLTALLALFFAISRGQTKDSDATCPANDKTCNELARVKSNYPVVDYSTGGAPQTYRREKGEKYGAIPSIWPEINGNEQETIIIDWESGLPALPTGQSEVILIGSVSDAKALLSADKSLVFSEFQIRIETVFKNTSKLHLRNLDIIVGERQGGVVRYQNGFDKWVRVAGQRMPKVGAKYLFFLSLKVPGRRTQSEDLSILTAFEIVGDSVVTLDNPSGGTHPIARKYSGRPIADLLRDLEQLLMNEDAPSKGSAEEIK